MKTFLIVLTMLTFIESTPEAQAMFGRVHAERERRQQAEKLVIQEQQANAQLINSNQRLHVTISVLSTGVVVALIVGTAVGSKTKKDHDSHF